MMAGIGTNRIVLMKSVMESSMETSCEESGLEGIIMAGESSGEKIQLPKSSLNSDNNKDKKKPKRKRSPIIIDDHITVLSGHPIRYKCNICTREFKTKQQIKYHKFCRGGEKPFKCDVCDKCFKSKSYYKCHLRIHTGERPYVCQERGIGFSQSGKLNRHFKSRGGEQPFVSNQGCGRRFATAQGLRSHSYTHTGEKPFACQYCDKQLTRACNMKDHIRVHTGERPYQCQVCRRCFARKLTLDVHMKTHRKTHPSESKECPRWSSALKDLKRHSSNDASQPGENSLEDHHGFTVELIHNEGSENVTTINPPDDETMPQFLNVHSLASLDTWFRLRLRHTRQLQATRTVTSNQVPATSTCQSSSENLMEMVEGGASSHTWKSLQGYGSGVQNLSQPLTKIASRSGDASSDLKRLTHHTIRRKKLPSLAPASFSSKASSAPAIATVSIPGTAEPANLHCQSGMNSATSGGGTCSVSTEANDNPSSNVPSAAELISNLKVETAMLKSESLWLIAGQESTKKIRCFNKNVSTCGAEGAIRDIAIPPGNPVASGVGFAFYPSTFNGHPCVLFLQEVCDHKISHSCIEIMEQGTGWFFGKNCPWSSAGQDEAVTVQVSVLPHCIVSSVADFLGFPGPSLAQKYFVLLSSLAYWGHEHMSDLLVFSDVKDPHLVHVVPAYTSPFDLRRKFHISMSSRDFDDFQRAFKQLVLQSKILSDTELQVFFNILSGSSAQVKAQLTRFLQIKLFLSTLHPEDMVMFKASQSEQVFVEWLQKERDFCMFEFVMAPKNRSKSISPLRRAYIEFLAVPDFSARDLLDLIVEIC